MPLLCGLVTVKYQQVFILFALANQRGLKKQKIAEEQKLVRSKCWLSTLSAADLYESGRYETPARRSL